MLALLALSTAGAPATASAEDDSGMTGRASVDARPEPLPAEAPNDLPPVDLHFELPLVDVPFQTENGGAWPSMEQATWVTANLYQGSHFLLAKLLDPHSPRWGKALGAKVIITVFDGLTVLVPGFLAWQHEEWHRAVMSWRDIGSYDDVYNLDFGGITNVSHVTDEDLVRLKAQHPADSVRMSMAGIEGNYAEAFALEKMQFFEHTTTWNTATLWWLYFGNSDYLHQCASSSADTTTNEQNQKEGTDVPRRDFTGLDCDGWTYDLFRPDEPYAARGVHPSGVGIDRYRGYSQLSPAEQRFTRKQFWLSLLNFADPNLIGFQRFRLPWLVRGEPLDFNAALRLIPAAFGYDVRLDLFLQRMRTQNVLVSLHGYFNRGGPLPGLEVALYRLPVGHLAGATLRLGGRVAGWLQPARLRYDSDGIDVGGLIAARAGLGLLRACEPYVEVEAKSSGWVTGSVFLDANVSARIGLIAQF